MESFAKFVESDGKEQDEDDMAEGDEEEDDDDEEEEDDDEVTTSATAMATVSTHWPSKQHIFSGG